MTVLRTTDLKRDLQRQLEELRAELDDSPIFSEESQQICREMEIVKAGLRELTKE